MIDYSEHFITIVFMQGEEASEVFDIWDDYSIDEVVGYLAQWDYGNENNEAALIMNETYATIEEVIGESDHVELWESEHGNYWVAYNRSFNYISLMRKIGK